MALTYSSFSFQDWYRQNADYTSVVNISQTEVQTDGFGVADVQIAVRLGRETGLDGCMFTAFEVFFDDGADKMVVRELVFIQHNISLIGK